MFLALFYALMYSNKYFNYLCYALKALNKPLKVFFEYYKSHPPKTFFDALNTC